MARKTKTQTAPQAEEFTFRAPEAQTVELVGDFTRWEEQPIPLVRGPDGIWRTHVELPPGEHHYRFLVDGEWHDDPQCELRVPTPFGVENAVRQVA